MILILDQTGWHMAKVLKVPDNIGLLYLLACSPELNPIERLWVYLKSHYLSNRAYTDYDDLFEVCLNSWNKITVEQFRTVCHVEWILHET